MTLQAVDDLRAVAKNLDKPATPRSGQATLAPTKLRQIIQRRRDAISASTSFKEWVATVEPGAKVPQQGVTFWHLLGANKTTAQLLPDAFATGLSTQVNEGSNWAALTL